MFGWCNERWWRVGGFRRRLVHMSLFKIYLSSIWFYFLSLPYPSSYAFLNLNMYTIRCGFGCWCNVLCHWIMNNSLSVCLSFTLPPLSNSHKINWLQCVAFLSREYSTQFSMIRLKLMLSATCGKEIRPFLVAVQRFMYSVHIEWSRQPPTLPSMRHYFSVFLWMLFFHLVDFSV